MSNIRKYSSRIGAVLVIAAVGLGLTFAIRAGSEGRVDLESDNEALRVTSDEASEGSYIEFAQKVTEPAGCDTGFTANIFDADFSENKTGATKADVEKALGTSISYWSPDNTSNLDIKDGYLRARYVPSSKGSNHFTFTINLNGGKGFEEVWWEQQVFPESGWDWGGKNEGGKLNGLQGGTSDAPWDGPPSGGYPPFDGEGFSLRNMWRNGRSNGQEGRIIGYTYHIDQPGRYGDDLGASDDIYIPVGKWSTITHRVKMNSNDNQAKGAGDGVWEMWVNGEKVVSNNKLRLSANGNTHNIEQWVFSTFYGGNDSSWSPDKTTYMRFRCLKAASADPFSKSVSLYPEI